MTDSIGPAEAEAGGILTIDLAAIVANWRALGRRAAPANCAAVIKADAYGCGIEQVAAALAKAGCDTFFVATLAEARRARSVAAEAAIYVLNGLLPGTAPAYAAANLRPILGSTIECDEWSAFRAASGFQGAAALHIDTGMNRLGFAHEEAAQLAPRLRPRWHRAGDEPLRLLGGRASAERDPDRALRRGARAVSRHRGIALQFLGHLSRKRGAS